MLHLHCAPCWQAQHIRRALVSRQRFESDKMKVGELVEITRAHIGTPIGTIGLIMERERRQYTHGYGYIYTVHLVGKPDTVRTRRFLGKDMRVIK